MILFHLSMFLFFTYVSYVRYIIIISNKQLIKHNEVQCRVSNEALLLRVTQGCSFFCQVLGSCNTFPKTYASKGMRKITIRLQKSSVITTITNTPTGRFTVGIILSRNWRILGLTYQPKLLRWQPKR